jgi:hypothetical protein
LKEAKNRLRSVIAARLRVMSWGAPLSAGSVMISTRRRQVSHKISQRMVHGHNIVALSSLSAWRICRSRPLDNYGGEFDRHRVHDEEVGRIPE